MGAIKNAIDGCVVPGAGSVEVAVAEALTKYKLSVNPGRAQFGVQAFVDAHLLIIPKVLVQNSGFYLQETFRSSSRNSESG